MVEVMSLEDVSSIGGTIELMGSKRQPLRERIAQRGDRQALREARRQELENQIREELCLVQPDVEVFGGRCSPDTFCDDERGQAARPRTNGSRHERDVGAPTRPPKPKPHRPLCTTDAKANFAEQPIPDLGSSSPSSAGPKRWRSALLPVWPDRQAPSGTDSDGLAAFPGIGTNEDGNAGASNGEGDIESPGLSLGKVCLTEVSRVRPPLQIPSIKTLVVEADADLVARTRQLEESARRLRDNSERVRAENRRARLRGSSSPTLEGEPNVPTVAIEKTTVEERTCSSARARSSSADRRLRDMRRRIAELDEVNAMEQQRLDDERLEMEERHRNQEKFEAEIQERTERYLREQREQELLDLARQEQRSEELRRDLQDRARRRKERQRSEEEHSRTLEVKRREFRSEKEQQKWQIFEEELDRQWAEQEAEEKRRLEAYARDRMKQYEEWDRLLSAERRRLGSDADHNTPRNRASWKGPSTEQPFRSPPRPAASHGLSGQSTRRPPQPRSNRAPCQNIPFTADSGVTPPPISAGKVHSPDESAVLQELQSVRASTRDVQKAKVKDLLFRWHPDKNPTCQEKATRLFQFVQQNRMLVLGL